ncbi:unnamed protein product [Leptidea sinapis]|uniref:Major facilitator superfamily (MFS) profile domain-containing protein n=1 Tax=Leptidea sinapis TaxID=189913 RepID=A0A5E4QZK5_9NEOP|nr:unnamed protein product [Leptidea sinapis]
MGNYKSKEVNNNVALAQAQIHAAVDEMSENNLRTVSGDVDDEREADVDYALSVAGTGSYNIKYVLNLSLFLIATIIEPVGLSFVLPAAKCDLNMSDTQRGFIASIPYIGLVVTSFAWGYLVDTRGRKNIVILSSFLSGIFAIASAFMPTFFTFALTKFLVIAGPAAIPFTYIGEIIPKKYRDTALSVTNGLQMTGAVLVPLLAWLVLSFDFRIDFGSYFFTPWRLLTIVNALPFIISSVLMSFGPESPKYLLSKGNHDESLQVLRTIYAANKGKSPDDFPSLPLLKPPYLKWMILNGILLFGVFATLNGLNVWVPDLLNRVFTSGYEGKTACAIISQRQNEKVNEDTECDDSIGTLTFVIRTIGSAACAVIGLVAGSSVKLIGKKFLLILVYMIIGICIVMINFVTQQIVFATLLSSIALTALAIGPINAFSVQIFPTHLRGMAISLTMMSGRFGSIVGANVIGSLINAACEVTFYSYGGVLIDNRSTRSFISPEKRKHISLMQNNMNHLQSVTSTHASNVHHEVANIPLFSIFNESRYHKFYIYNVDHRYDGLIGMDLMSRLSADICLKDKTLKTNSANISIAYNTDHELLLDPRTEHRVRLPVNQKDGFAILDYKQFRDGVRMPTAIVKCDNYFAPTVIQNTTDLQMKLTITAPFKVTEFYNDECFPYVSCVVDKMNKTNLKTITDVNDVHPADQEMESALSVAGTGCYNIKYSLVLALFLIAATVELFGYSYVLPAAKCDFNMTDTERGYVASIPYVGLVATSFVWGYLVDTCGRKKVLVLSSLATVLAWAILPFQFQVDFGTLKFTEWRLLTIVYSLPFIISAILLSFGPESPKFLLSRGKHVESLQVLGNIYARNSGKSPIEYPIKQLKIENGHEKTSFLKSLLVQLNGLYICMPDVLNVVLTSGRDDMTACAVIAEKNNATSTKLNSCHNSVDPMTYVTHSAANASCALIALVASATVKIIGKKFLLVVIYIAIGTSIVLINFITHQTLLAILLAAMQVTASAIGPLNTFSVQIFPTHLSVWTSFITTSKITRIEELNVDKIIIT